MNLGGCYFKIFISATNEKIGKKLIVVFIIYIYSPAVNFSRKSEMVTWEDFGNFTHLAWNDPDITDISNISLYNNIFEL